MSFGFHSDLWQVDALRATSDRTGMPIEWVDGGMETGMGRSPKREPFSEPSTQIEHSLVSHWSICVRWIAVEFIFAGMEQDATITAFFLFKDRRSAPGTH